MKVRKAAASAAVLAVLSAAFSAPASGVGVLVARARVEPPKVYPGEKTTIYIDARDGYQRPLAGVGVKITAETGHFEANRERLIRGASDPRGEFKVEWRSDLETKPGEQVFTIIASKSGYLGKYPLSAIVTIVAPSDTEPDSAEKPESEDISAPFGLP